MAKNLDVVRKNDGLSHHLFRLSDDWEQSLITEYCYGVLDIRTPRQVDHDDKFWASNNLMRYDYYDDRI